MATPPAKTETRAKGSNEDSTTDAQVAPEAADGIDEGSADVNSEMSQDDSPESTDGAPIAMSDPTEQRPNLDSLLDAEDARHNHRSNEDTPPISQRDAPSSPSRRQKRAKNNGSAIVQYHDLVQRLTVDGTIEDWAWDELDRAREKLGISDEAHEQIIAELVTEDQLHIALSVDAASSQGYILGERCTMVLRLNNIDEQALDTVRVWYTSTASQGRLKIDIERLGPEESRKIFMPFWPDDGGMHELEGVVELTPLMGATQFLEFGPIGFRVGRRPAADLHIEMDPSPVHIQRQPLTRGDPYATPGLLGPPQWRHMELRRIRRGAAELWLRRHPIRHPSSGASSRIAGRAPATSQRIAAVQALWGEAPPEPPSGVAGAWQGPPLRTIFRECLDTDGEVDRYHSLFEVLADGERLLATTAGGAFGAQLRNHWEWMKSEAYGAEVCRQIRRHGLDHVQRLLCAPTGWQGQPANFKRRDISAILGHSHDRLEQMTIFEHRHPSTMAKVRQEGSIESWQSRRQELSELCQLCSLLIDAYQNIGELDYLKRQELDSMAWSTRRDGLVLYLETAQLLKTYGFTIGPTMRTSCEYRENG